MRAILILVAGGGLFGCGANVCDRMDQLRTECNATPADADVAACRRTIRDCDSDQVDLLDGYLDCLVEGVEDGECFISNPEKPETDPSAGCFAALLTDDDLTCASAVTSL
ncbi:MAG: hypothetical protein AAF602_10750 [Myxococcota bacterium]